MSFLSQSCDVANAKPITFRHLMKTALSEPPMSGFQWGYFDHSILGRKKLGAYLSVYLVRERYMCSEVIFSMAFSETNSMQLKKSYVEINVKMSVSVYLSVCLFLLSVCLVNSVMI